MAPTTVTAPSGSTFQDIARLEWQCHPGYGRAVLSSLGRYHDRLLRAYGLAYLGMAQGSSIAAELEGATWAELIRAALRAGFPMRVDALDQDMAQRHAAGHPDDMTWVAGSVPYRIARPAYLTSCHGCSLPMFTDTTTRQFCNGCLRRHERDKKRNQRGTDLSDRLCATCGASFTPKRSTATFCSTKCRVAAHRAKAKGE